MERITFSTELRLIKGQFIHFSRCSHLNEIWKGVYEYEHTVGKQFSKGPAFDTYSHHIKLLKKRNWKHYFCRNCTLAS